MDMFNNSDNLLWKKDNYRDKNRNFLISTEIYEYDMRDAGFNIIVYYKLKNDKTIKSLASMRKSRRQNKIGVLQKDKEFSKKLVEHFALARQMFFEANNLKEEEILDIKKDAIFVTRVCNVTEFDNIKFVEKNMYTSYLYLNKLQFYASRNHIDVKGLGNLRHKHDEYMLDFIKTFLNLMETTDETFVIKFLKEFVYHYKAKNLDIGYYRELNEISLYKTNRLCFDRNIYVDDYGEYDDLDISYNYFNYLVPMMKILL